MEVHEKRRARDRKKGRECAIERKGDDGIKKERERMGYRKKGREWETEKGRECDIEGKEENV